ncbi:hypothetical protein RBSH_00605 [Rhodopirellula baltica SH28]|uniref:Uncharacterized protein n=1 Tax=Rhodopirellula baltica SH28 TaxID=993517 RepID=K5DLV2_RHOBT|nr:hypothetical protein RBSH_00605 [Rhodopirellula baltica SH28]
MSSGSGRIERRAYRIQPSLTTRNRPPSQRHRSDATRRLISIHLFVKLSHRRGSNVDPHS